MKNLLSFYALSFLMVGAPLLSFAEDFPERGPVAQTWDEAFDRLGPIEGAPPPETRPELEGKVVTGYQGWFAAEGDGSGMGWKHYGGSRFAPGSITFDLWPDMSELDADEQYPTPFKYEDGSTATLFSSYNPKTVDRHFRWMKEYGIDAAMLQRFGVSLRSPGNYDFRTAVMENVRRAAERHDRSWAVMYDLSGFRADEVVPIITEDWKRLNDRGEILTDQGYLHHQEQPLVAIWGVGFADGRAYGLEEAAALIDFFKNDPEYGGNAVMLGIPYHWRTQERDAVTDPELHDLLKTADILSPWAVGRYHSMAAAAEMIPDRLAGDIEWTQEHGLTYLPVIFPGFSWQNLERFRGRDSDLNRIPREDGRFLWLQALEALRAGSTALYVAMFDEVDEATAIFKGSNNPPVGESNFITYEGLPSDHYLWLTGQIRALLRGEIPKSEDPPQR